jgi:hypothetical protein
MTANVDFESFRTSWLESITEGALSTGDLGRKFAQKLVYQWLDSAEATEFVFCDGAGDGGIDIALLDTASEDPERSDVSGSTWYLVQSKYGSAFAGTGTLLIEGQKVIETLDGKRQRLNSLAEGLLERLTHFRKSAGAFDRIVLVFGTERALSEDEKRVLLDLRAMGRERLGFLFDVEAISIETIYARLQDEEAVNQTNRLRVTLDADMVQSGPDLLIGSIKLTKLYAFLKAYREATSDLDRIYEKNVRRFLGGRGKVNRGMQATLRDAPQHFGLYNNGITIVVHDYALDGVSVELAEPYIVNGCQTSRTIWEVFHQRLGSGATGSNPELEAWKRRAERGVVVAKIVKVGDSGDSLLQAITRYTNSQNAVRDKDFLALISDFRSWQSELGRRYDLYLEIQRGGWDSQKALQNTSQTTKQFSKYANAADLIKVIGAGWLGEAGTAFGKNPPFLPDGAIFKRIVNGTEEDGGPFGARDLYAAYLLQQATTRYGFGRAAEHQSRRQTRFLFYMVAVDLLKDVMSRSSMSTSLRAISDALIAVLGSTEASEALLGSAVEVIDTYLTSGSEESVFNEPAYMNAFNSDLNAFLKSEQLGRSNEASPRLRNLFGMTKMVMGPANRIHRSPREVIATTLKSQ